MSDNLSMLPPPAPVAATPSRSRLNWDFVIIGVLALVVLALAAYSVMEVNKKNEAEKQVAEISSQLDEVSSDLDAAESELAAARAASDSKTAEVSRLESEAVELRQCAQGLVRSMTAALDEDWLTANSILQGVKTECEMAMSGTTTL